MRPLLITPEIKDAVHALCARARAHPVPLEWLEKAWHSGFQAQRQAPAR